MEALLVDSCARAGRPNLPFGPQRLVPVALSARRFFAFGPRSREIAEQFVEGPAGDGEAGHFSTPIHCLGALARPCHRFDGADRARQREVGK